MDYSDYIKLFDKVKYRNATHRHRPLTICPSVFGGYDSYHKDGCLQGKPLFVGRAVNGWCALDDDCCVDEFLDRLHKCEQCGLGWVVGDGNWNNCRENGCPVASASDAIDGRMNYTPFWQMVRFICEVENYNYKDKWYKNIVWTNLYKASYALGGNPTDFYKEQIDLCNNILIEEIKMYQPCKIYFITEVNRRKNKQKRTWFCRENDICFKRVYDYLKKNKLDDRVVVLTRPEFHNLQKIWDNREDLDGNKLKNKI